MVARAMTYLDHRSTPASGQWWRIEPSLVIWLRLTPHSGELRGSVFSGMHDRRLQRSTPLTWQISKHSQRAIVRAEQTMQRQLACHLATSIPRATTLRANGDSVSLEAIRSPAFKNGRCMAPLDRSDPPLGFSAFFNSKNLRFCDNCTEMIL
jgi:hypothetical protein